MRDPHDQVFLDLALAAAPPVLVTGDADLLVLQESARPLQIVNPPRRSSSVNGSKLTLMPNSSAKSSTRQ